MKLQNLNRVTIAIYYSILVLLILLILLTPSLIQSGYWMLAEEFIEGGLITLALSFFFFMQFFMKREVNKRENTLQNLYKEFGKINIQISQINDVFANDNKLPKSKNDFKKILKEVSKKMLAIVPDDWVIIRIVDLENERTLAESAKARGDVVVIQHKVSNHDLVQNAKIDKCVTFASNSQDITIKTFCIFPATKHDSTTEVFITSVLNYIDMMYVIFSSSKFKKKD